MRIDENEGMFRDAVEQLDDEQVRKLDASLSSGSGRYVKIDLSNGKCDISSVSELDELASSVEEARRSQGEAGESIFEKEECIDVLKGRAENLISRLSTIFDTYLLFAKNLEAHLIKDKEELQKFAAEFKTAYENKNGPLAGKAILKLDHGKQWEVTFKPETILVEKVCVREQLFTEEEELLFAKDEKEPLPDEKNVHTFPGREYTSEEEAASRTIQRAARGYLARKAFLPQEMYQDYKQGYEEIIEAKRKGEKISEAEGGTTDVYLPQKMPSVVFKATGYVPNKDVFGELQLIEKLEGVPGAKRFKQMLEVREILRSQGSKYLVIPKARGYKGFLIEQRLPINTNYYYNMGLYATNPEKFDDAVREFTRLFSRAPLEDIVCKWKVVCNDNVDNTVRFDNLPFYIEDSKGKIGLIDLEHIKIKSGEPSLNVEDLTTLARIFPLHMNIIKEEAKKIGVRSLPSSIRTESEKGIKSLEEGYTKYRNWLMENEITPSSTHKIEVTPERFVTLKKMVESEIVQMNQGINRVASRRKREASSSRDFLVSDAKTIAEQVTPIILSFVDEKIEGYQSNKSKVRNESDMMDVRSFVFTCSRLKEDIQKQLKNISVKQDFNDFDDLAINLLTVIMEELIKGKEVYSFNPDYDIPHGHLSLRF